MKTPILSRTPARVLTFAAITAMAASFPVMAGTAASASTAATSPQLTDAGAPSLSKRMQKRSDGKRGKYHRRAMKDVAMVVPGYGPIPKDVVDTLALDSDQQALLDEARAFMRDSVGKRGQGRDRFNADRPASADAPLLNPRARLEQRQQRFESMRQVYAEGSEKWLSLWDALEPSQQQTVSDYVVRRNEQIAERRAAIQEKRVKRQARTADAG